MEITSSAFREGEKLPRRYTCDGENLSPPLSWSGLPEGVQSLVLICHDPDAPRGDFTHWILFDLPADLTTLPEDAQGKGTPGQNDFRRLGYGGPCPPPGPAHRYVFRLYALNRRLGLRQGAGKAEVEKSMQGSVLDHAQLVGRYAR
jgi:Raf kinase inhibitor-like YbhB/YbcL family protein